MEPDVVSLYSSSPLQLDEGGEEEDEDDFGEFGVYCCGVSSSFSFSELDTSSTSGQSSEVDTFGRNLTETEKLTQNLQEESKSEQLKYQNDKKLEVLTGVSLSIMQNEPSEVFSRGHHRLSSTSEPQHIKLCTDPDPDRSICTETVLVSRTDIVAGNSSLEAGQGSTAFTGSPAPLDAHREVFRSGKNVVKEGRTEIKEGLSNKEMEVRDEKEEVQMQDGSEDPAELPNTPPVQVVKVSLVLDAKLTENNETSDEPGIKVDDSNETMASSREEQINHGAFDASPDPLVEKVIDNIKETKASFSEEPGCDVSENLAKINPTSDAQFIKNITESAMSPTVELAAETEGEEQFKETTVAPTVETFYQDEPDGVMTEVKSNSVDFKVDLTQGFGDVTESTQDGFADFVTALTCCSTDDEFEDTDSMQDLKEEEEELLADDEDSRLFSELPPSESFADFSSAPFGGLAGAEGECWSAFGQQEEFGRQPESWAAFDEGRQSGSATEPHAEDLQTDLVLDGLSLRLQHLLKNVFPLEITLKDPEVLTLMTLLELKDREELRFKESVALWHHLLDIHSAHGLKVQWVGSRSNRILLDCLGIHNILFTGQNKQPMIVPMFAAGLGMLEPTKDPVKASPVFPSFSPSQGRSTLCTQVAASLNFYQDAAITHLNLDFFGPVDDSSSDSDTDGPLPGVDPELYELTTAGTECSTTAASTVDVFSKLMESIEKNSTVTRKPEIDEHTSEEAVRVLSLLPDLSFMTARVLMFPSTLTPTLGHL
ncbi:aftiphilin isoform X3 [Trichomycterus rosablanca]|uniref:aftiphilin isoform X3 n=1 Tax=Trichomycterus rosablanca TaxID=2290929 RepID=UPI002F356950